MDCVRTAVFRIPRFGVHLCCLATYQYLINRRNEVSVTMHFVRVDQLKQ